MKKHLLDADLRPACDKAVYPERDDPYAKSPRLWATPVLADVTCKHCIETAYPLRFAEAVIVHERRKWAVAS